MDDNREKYEGVGFFTRIFRMCRGLGRPRDSADYKRARLELTRLSAPVTAILFVVTFVTVTAILTAVSETESKRQTIVVAELEPEEVTETEDLPEEDPPEEEVDPTVDVTETSAFASSDPTPTLPPAPAAPAGGTPNAALKTPSPVTMNAIVASTGVKFGPGVGTGGFGSEIKGGGGQNVEGCLIGRIVDFKSNPDGTPRTSYSATGTYWKDAKSLVDANFGDAAFGAFFSPEKRVALTHLWVPPQKSENGPAAFGVAGAVKPSGFAVYYTGTLKSATAGRYRFWGYFDDFMLVRVNGKTVMDAEWNSGGLAAGHVTGWKTSDPAAVGRVKCPQAGGKMTPGDWFAVDPHHPAKVELLVGERPGGMVGGLLLVEQEGAAYAKAADGTTVLPIFAARPLAETTKLDLAEGSYKMSTDSPRFNARPRNVAAVTKDDVAVDVNL